MKNFLLVRGKPSKISLEEALKKMGPNDVVIKGANALDARGTAGIFLASPRGGTIGKILEYVKAKGINLIMPVGIEKFVPGSLSDISKKAGIFQFGDATRCAVGLAVVDGKIITELEAVEILSGAEAKAMGAGGVSGAEGSVTLLISGKPNQIRRIMKLIRKIKGIRDPRIKISCKNCKHQDCFYSSYSS